MSRRIFITVAEVSGDKHAAQLIHELKRLDPSLIIEGVGGPEMAAAGAVIHRNTVIKAAMGWRGILRAGEVYRLLRWTRRYFDENKVDLWIGVDSPSMNFHFADAAHARKIPTLQYVAPQLWAWAIWRMKKLRRWVDRVACILPFEEKFFADHGVNATFVGHPLFDELPPRTIAALQERFPNRPPIIGLLAGSRKSEATANFPMMLVAAGKIIEAFPDATFLAPTTAATHPVVERLVGSTSAVAEPPDSARARDSTPNASAKADPTRDSRNALAGKIEVALGSFDEMVPRCDLCLTVSGTATLHVAAFNVPMVVVYYVSRWTWTLVGQFLVPTRTFALVNVLAQKAGLPDGALPAYQSAANGHLVTELVPWTAPAALSDRAIEMLRDPAQLQWQRQQLAKLIAPLDQHGASLNVAKLAMGMMK